MLGQIAAVYAALAGFGNARAVSMVAVSGVEGTAEMDRNAGPRMHDYRSHGVMERARSRQSCIKCP